jgi:ATP-binding cassette subfamily C protein
MSNVLMLTGAVFMLEIYDRVLPSRSVPTLIGIAILAGGLYVVQGILDLIRSRVLVRIGGTLDEAVSGRVFDTILRGQPAVHGRSMERKRRRRGALAPSQKCCA